MRDESANAISALDIADVQLEAGGSATPFDRLSIGDQLSACERYFQKGYSPEVQPGTPSYPSSENCQQNTTSNVFQVHFRKSMPRYPTITLYNPRTGASGSWSQLQQDIPVTAGDIGTNGFDVDVHGGGQDEKPLAGHWTANAEL